MALLAGENCKDRVNSNVHESNARQTNELHKGKESDKSPFEMSIVIYNKLQVEIRILKESKLKLGLKKWLIKKEFYEIGDFRLCKPYLCHCC